MGTKGVKDLQVETVAVLVHNRDFLGTKIIHLAFFSAIKRAFPGARLVALSPFSLAPVDRGTGLVDEVIQYPKSLKKLAACLRSLGAGAVVDLRPQSAWISLAVWWSRAPLRLSYQGALNGWLMSDVVPRDTGIYRLENYLNLLQPVNTRPQSLYRSDKPLYPLGDLPAYDLLLMPGGGAGDFKRWPLDRYCELLRQMYADGRVCSHAWVLGPDEANYLNALKKAEDPLPGPVYFNATMADISTLTFRAGAVVANDCGPAHFAHAYQRPRVLLFSNHDSKVARRIDEWFLPGDNARVIAGQPGRPINSIAVESVFSALAEVAAARSGA